MEITSRELRWRWCHGAYIYDLQQCKWNYLIKLLEPLKFILAIHMKMPQHLSKRNIFFLILLLCSQHECVLAPMSFLLFPIFFLYLPSFRRARSRCSNLGGYFCRLCTDTLTDGPSCRNVLPLSWDVLETPCQLLIQADWCKHETNR